MVLYLPFLEGTGGPREEKRDRVFFSPATWSTKEIFSPIMEEKGEKSF